MKITKFRTQERIWRSLRCTYCAEPCKAFITKESLDGIETGDYDIDSQVKLDSIEEKWFIKVSLYDDLLVFKSIGQVSQCLKQRDAVTLRAHLWLGYKRRIRVCLLVGCKAHWILIIGELESRWDKAEALRVDIHAELHGFAKDILVGQQLYIRVPVTDLGTAGLQPF